MKTFAEWMDEQPQNPVAPNQKWKATKEEIIAFWKNLRPDIPIQMKPVAYDHTGTTYSEDGIRLTGSKEFISSVLPRLKEFLNFETPTTKLQVVYRETDSPANVFGQNKTSFVFYIQTKERGKGKKDIPQIPAPQKIMPPKV